MRIETNTNLVYDEQHEKCLCITSQADGRAFAFVQCLDVGHDGKGERAKRYWGLYDPENPAASIERIMRNGG
ncbi:hypothetical protein A1OW_23015, partial [Enterovibrio norvegicus]|uniref:hypothetical protein n=1 Tax=Enterovibrio norvegicus TaxID=188144 RepID=UPI0004749081